MCFFFFFQAEDGIRDGTVTGVQTCALPIFAPTGPPQAMSDLGSPSAGGPGSAGSPRAGGDGSARGGALAESKPPIPLSSDVAAGNAGSAGGIGASGAVLAV